MNIVATISENCRRFPDKTAVSFKGNRLTYGELGERSKSIAAYLSQLGFYRKCIAIQTDDLIEHVAAILGCLLSGNYYLPVSEDNIWYIDEHFPIPIAAKLVTTATGRQEEHVILAHLPPAPAAWQPAAINEADNMYVLITSGSSGRPKVVVHNYKNINEDICRQIADNNITTADRVDLLFSLTFSASVSCLYTALVAGAELCIYSIRQQGIAGLIPFWEQMKITYATI
jgi:acyl-CoA synthetase (AMP-forming)/AMP-acid ligase II